MTAREKVLAQREAYMKGAMITGYSGAAAAERAARIAYPMPTETRDRTVKVDGLTYRFKDGEFQFLSEDGVRWIGSLVFYPEGVAKYTALADLVANPTEEVEVTA